MNDSTKDIWRGRWKQMRGKIQETWGDLSGDELDQLAGKRDQLVGQLVAALDGFGQGQG